MSERTIAPLEERTAAAFQPYLGCTLLRSAIARDEALEETEGDAAVDWATAALLAHLKCCPLCRIRVAGSKDCN